MGTSIADSCRHRIYLSVQSLLILLACACPSYLWAFQDSAEVPPANGTPLVDEQAGLAKQFGDLENLLLKLSEIEADTNPVRASILQRASKLGKQSSIQGRLKEAAKALENKQFSRAIEEQQATKAGLEELLSLLLSEDRDDRVREEKKKIEELIKEIQRLNRLQKSLRTRTESSDQPQELSQDQSGLEEKAADLAKEFDDDSEGRKENPEENKPENETEQREPKEGSPEDQKTDDGTSKPNNNPSEVNPNSEKTPSDSSAEDKPPGEKEPTKTDDGKGDKPMPSTEPKDIGDGTPKESSTTQESDDKPPQESADSPPSESEPNSKPPMPSDGNSAEPSKPQDSSESGEPSSDSQEPGEDSKDSKPSAEKQPSKPQTPQQRIEQARQKMQEAKDKLEKAEKEEAIESQKAAEEELRQAVEELEQILRQLREEEVERTLVQLEARFRRMLEMQIEVNEETKKLDRIAADQRERAWEQRAINVSQGERKIIAEAERALLLLQEEGTSLAFPEAGEQLITDMQSVATRLDGSDVGVLTQTIESEIVSGLEEILEALTAAQKEMEKKKSSDGSPPPPPPPGGPQEQPLVDKLAELRLIRTLQMRINTRTNKLAELMGTKEDNIGLSNDNEMRQQIRELGGRQQRLQQITKDIVVGQGE
jgi:hypothetical protein